MSYITIADKDQKNNTAAWALKYKVQRAWEPIPVDGKNPNREGWQNERYEPEQIPEVFKPGRNIGLLLGEPSGWLIDIDLDTPAACQVARFFLPPTGCIFGRPGKPRSHYLYYVEGQKTKKFQRRKEPGKDDDTTIVEIRSTGLQTIFPPGIHKGTGEAITWEQYDEPATVEAGELLQAASLVAAAAAIADAWPGEGSRQDAAMALAGGLLRGGWSIPEVMIFFEAVTTAAGDEEAESRINAIKYTAEKLGKGEEVTGWPRLKELIGNDPVELVIKWLNLKKEESDEPVILEVFTAADLLTQDLLPVKYHVDGILPEKGLGMLAGPFKAGKSFFVLQMAICLARGEPFLGFDTVKSRVLILSGEGGKELLKDRLVTMAGEGQGMENILFHVPAKSLDLSQEANLISLAKTCNDNRIDVVITDPLIKFNTRDENSTKEMAAFVNGLHELRHSAGVAVWMAHHTRKPGKDGGSSGNEARGSSVLAGEVDSLLMLNKRASGDFTLHFTLRWTEEPRPLRLEMDTGCLFLQNKGDLERGNTKLTAELLYQYIQEGGPSTIKQLAEMTDTSENTVRTYLKKLEKEGLVSYEKGERGLRTYFSSSDSASQGELAI